MFCRAAVFGLPAHVCVAHRLGVASAGGAGFYTGMPRVPKRELPNARQ